MGPVPVSLRGRPSQTSSRTARKSAVVVASNTWRLRKAQRMVARGSTLKLSNELLADSKTMNFPQLPLFVDCLRRRGRVLLREDVVMLLLRHASAEEPPP